MFESQENKDIRKNPLDINVKKSIGKALYLIEQQFENSFKKENNLDFHNTQHTKDVIRRTKLILETIRMVAPDAVSDKDVALGEIAAAFHDVVQGWEENQLPEKTIRKRFTGINEIGSAKMACEFLSQINEGAGEIFIVEDFNKINEAIKGTVPGYNIENKTVIQPNINEQSSLIAKALALADLGTAGMDGAEAFLREGDALFREENIDIMRAFEYQESITNEDKIRYRERILQWIKIQPSFVLGRKNLLDQELCGIPEKAIDSVKKLFGKFDESIEVAINRVVMREQMSFDELAIDMGLLKKMKF